jgi:predicted ATPase
MGRFHVIVGPNASGKTTFLDVVAFLGTLVSGGLDEAISERTQNLEDLFWGREGDSFELAIELRIPDELRERLGSQDHDTVRYEVAIGLDRQRNQIDFWAETVLLITQKNEVRQRKLFPMPATPPKTILWGPKTKGARTVISKVIGGNDNFHSEVHSRKSKAWSPAFRLGPHRSALGNLPEDETTFPVATWLKNLLANGIQEMVLNSLWLRQASPAGQGPSLKADGANLPWVVHTLEREHPERLRDWVAHIQTALPDFEGIRTVERRDDKKRYLMLRYRGGLEIPSWVASDGTLRLLALTLPAYLTNVSGIYLIEEPENGIHPRAVETMFQSLSSIYGAQVLLATHSPVVLSIVDTDQLLCFAKDESGATDIVLGRDHPMLRDWRQDTALSTLFAAGVLG